MNAPALRPGPTLPQGLPHRPQAAPGYRLSVRQQPESAKLVVRGKEKDRKTIDPPPVVQLEVVDNTNPPCSFLHSPYYNVSVYLIDEDKDEPKHSDRLENGPALIGTTTSSMTRLKDLNNTEGGYFVFSDLSAKIHGWARLKFILYELKTFPQPDGSVSERNVCLTTVTSQKFEVANAKDWDGVRESTVLSRTFADQGVRLRLRKESRNSTSRRTTYAPPPRPSSNTPIRPHASHSASFESTASSQDDINKRQQRGLLQSTATPTYAAPGPGMSSYGQPMPSLYPPTSAHSTNYPAYQSNSPATGYGNYSYVTGQSPTYQSPYPPYGGYANWNPPPPQQPSPYQYSHQPPAPQYAPVSSYRQGGYLGETSSMARPMANPSTTPRLPPITAGNYPSSTMSPEDSGQVDQAQPGQRYLGPTASPGGHPY